jgi:Pyridoxamine 5'-phosphate oxidase
MAQLHLPGDVEAVLRSFFTCEFTTISRGGEPLTWPTEPLYEPETGLIIVTASIAFPVKALNARQNPRVSLLYSDPTGSRLDHLPAVLVQGEAQVTESLEWTPRTEALFRQSLLRQPDSAQFVSSPIIRRLFTFYFRRLMITVEPYRIYIWPDRDFSRAPVEHGLAQAGATHVE